MKKAALGRLFLCSYDLYNLPKIPFRWLLLARLYSLKSKEICPFFYDRSPGVFGDYAYQKGGPYDRLFGYPVPMPFARAFLSLKRGKIASKHPGRAIMEKSANLLTFQAIKPGEQQPNAPPS